MMKTPVNTEHIDQLNTLYHQYLKQNLGMYDTLPREFKALSTLDISVINIVASNPGVIVREIAEALKIPNSTLTSSLNRLEEKEIASRVISKRDRRSFSVELTEKGWKIQQVHLDFEKAYFEGILSKLDTDEDRETLLQLFRKILENSSSN